MRYRLYQPEDFAALYAIEEICFQPPLRFPRAYMQRLLQNPEGATWVAEDDGGMLGFAIVEWPHQEGEILAYIQTLEVLPGWRKQGVGAELLRRLESSAQSAGARLIWLHVDADNSSAIRLYQAHGYQCEAREEHYYARHRPALVYCKSLAPPRS